MSWNKVIGQHRVKDLLKKTLAQGQVAHAYLFHGIGGIGKDALALAFAGALNCETSRTDPCGTCASCRKMDTLQHPNVKFIVALPSGKGEKTGSDPVGVLTEEQVEELRQELGKKAADPYYQISLPKANFIKVNSIRLLRREASLSGFSQGRKVFIISNAEMMNAEASNSLLKTLEEPPGETVLILTTSRKEQLLPTIVSRCQVVRCEPLTEDEIADALMKQNGHSESEARVAAQLSNGSLVTARALVSEDMVRLRSEVVQFLRVALGNSPTSLLLEIENILSSSDRPAAERWLRMLQVWFHEAVALQNEGKEEVVGNDDLRRFVSRFSHANFLAASSAADRSVALIGKNVYLPLIFISLAVDLKRILYSPSTVPLEYNGIS